MQNKCIRFSLFLGNRTHIGVDEFNKINWLPVNERFTQITSAYVFKFFNNKTPAYIKDVFEPVRESGRNTRNSFLKLNQPSVKSNFGKNSLSFIGPQYWNSLTKEVKEGENVNSFKHRVKKHLFKKFEETGNGLFVF